MGRLSGKVALITADDLGLASAVAVVFAVEGAKVVYADHREERLGPIARALDGLRTDAQTLVFNPTSPESCESVVAMAVKRFGRLDVLCNLSGEFRRSGRIHEIGEDDWTRAIQRNLRSVLLVSRFAVPAIRAGSGAGSIVNLSHVAALNGVPGTSLIAATHGALINMTRDMAIQGSREGFRVNCVCVGSTFAPVIPSTLEEYQRRSVPAEEIAPVFVYLASDESRHVNGHILNVDDGMHAWR